MDKRLAMTVDGSYCTADDEHIGKGKCNHVEHQNGDENPQDFLDRMSKQKKNL